MQDSPATDTHLKKQLSPLNVWSLALGCIIGWGAFVMPGETFLVQAGPLGTFIAMAAAALIMIVIAFNYNFMIKRFPVAGGGFIYAQKTFGRTHGFVCAWFLSLSYLAVVPLNATALALIGRNVFGGVFQFGFHYTVAGYDVYLGELLLAIIALVIFAVLSLRGVKFSGVFQTILVFALVIGVLVVTGAAGATEAQDPARIEPLFAPNVSPLAGILAVVAVAPWAFVGFDTIPQAAEEFRFSPRKTKVIMILSIVFGAAVYAALTFTTAVAFPNGYESWTAYIADAPNLGGLESLPTFSAAYVLLGDVGVFFLVIAVCGACLSGIVGFYMATSRLLYAMARDNVIPQIFGKVHANFGTPSVAILFVMVISIIAPFFGRTALGWIVDMSSLGAAIGYGYTSLAALRHALREHHAPIVVSGVIGTILSCVFIVLLLVPIPGLNSSLGLEPYICLVLWIILGIVFYQVAKRKKAADKQA